MSSQYRTVLTVYGQTAIANAIASGTPIKIMTFQVGDGGGSPVPIPTGNETALVNTVGTFLVNQVVVDSSNPNTIIVQSIIPPTSGGYTIREFGLFDDSGNLIAYGNTGDTVKPTSSNGMTGNFIFNVRLQVSNTSAVNITVDTSSVIATEQWVNENYSIQALLPGGKIGQVLTKNSNIDGDVYWSDANAPDGGAFLQVGNTLSEIAASGTSAQSTARENIGVPDALAAFMQSVMNAVFPIGSIYSTVSSDNPANILGIGQWQKIQGRVLIGADGIRFINPGDTGGSASIVLSTQNLPSHQHAIPATVTTTVTSTNRPVDGLHHHTYHGTQYPAYPGASGSNTTFTFLTQSTAGATDGQHTHDIAIPANVTNPTPDASATQQPVSTVPPYFVCNIWKRIS